MCDVNIKLNLAFLVKVLRQSLQKYPQQRAMCDAEYHTPIQNPYIGPIPNKEDIFWWEFKAKSYTGAISSLSQWSEFSNNFQFSRLVVSLESCDFLVDEAVHSLFNGAVILDRGSWARMNATLRKAFHSSTTAEQDLPLTVKLGRHSSFQSVSSFVTMKPL